MLSQDSLHIPVIYTLGGGGPPPTFSVSVYIRLSGHIAHLIGYPLLPVRLTPMDEPRLTTADLPVDLNSKAYLIRAILEASENKFRLSDGYDESLITVSLPDLEKATHGSTSVSENAFICPICLGLPRQPVFSTRCGHIGCYGCLHALVTTKAPRLVDARHPECPICRKKISIFDLVGPNSWPLLLKQCWKIQRLRCPNSGCSFTADPFAVFEHERTACSYRMFVCPGSRCGFEGKQADVEVHALACTKVFLHCQVCKFPMRFINRSTHDCWKTEYYAGLLVSKRVFRGLGSCVPYNAVSADEVIDEHERLQPTRPSSPPLRQQIEEAMRSFAEVSELAGEATRERNSREEHASEPTPPPEPAPAQPPPPPPTSETTPEPVVVIEIDYVVPLRTTPPQARPRPTEPPGPMRRRRRNLFEH